MRLIRTPAFLPRFVANRRTIHHALGEHAKVIVAFRRPSANRGGILGATLTDEISGAQIREARALLGWSMRELSAKARVHRNTVWRVENDVVTHSHAAAQMARTMEAAGVEFTDGVRPGVRLGKRNER